MQTNGNVEGRRGAPRGMLTEVGSAEYSGSFRHMMYQALQERHLALFRQHREVFQPEHQDVPVTVGNLAATAYDQHQNATMEAMAQPALETSGVQYNAQPSYAQTAPTQPARQPEAAPQSEQMQSDDLAAIARANIEAATSDQPYAEPMPNLGDEPAIQAYAERGISRFEEYLMQTAEGQPQSEAANA